jgi:hypothetical protein
MTLSRSILTGGRRPDGLALATIVREVEPDDALTSTKSQHRCLAHQFLPLS